MHGSSSSTGGSDELRHGTGPERISALLRKLLTDAGSAAPLIPNTRFLMVKTHMEQIVANMLSASTVQELESWDSSIKDAAIQAKAFKVGVAKAAKSLKDHIENKNRAKGRREKQQEKDAHKRIIDAEKEKPKLQRFA